MKGVVGIGEDRMEEGEISTITQLRQIERRGRRTQTPARCTIKNINCGDKIICDENFKLSRFPIAPTRRQM